MHNQFCDCLLTKSWTYIANFHYETLCVLQVYQLLDQSISLSLSAK
jgi:hypothetical protein